MLRIKGVQRGWKKSAYEIEGIQSCDLPRSNEMWATVWRYRDDLKYRGSYSEKNVIYCSSLSLGKVFCYRIPNILT